MLDFIPHFVWFLINKVNIKKFTDNNLNWILLCGDMFFVLMEKEDKKPYLEKHKGVHKEYLIKF